MRQATSSRSSHGRKSDKSDVDVIFRPFSPCSGHLHNVGKLFAKMNDPKIT